MLMLPYGGGGALGRPTQILLSEVDYTLLNSEFLKAKASGNEMSTEMWESQKLFFENKVLSADRIARKAAERGGYMGGIQGAFDLCKMVNKEKEIPKPVISYLNAGVSLLKTGNVFHRTEEGIRGTKVLSKLYGYLYCAIRQDEKGDVSLLAENIYSEMEFDKVMPSEQGKGYYEMIEHFLDPERIKKKVSESFGYVNKFIKWFDSDNSQTADAYRKFQDSRWLGTVKLAKEFYKDIIDFMIKPPKTMAEVMENMPDQVSDSEFVSDVIEDNIENIWQGKPSVGDKFVISSEQTQEAEETDEMSQNLDILAKKMEELKKLQKTRDDLAKYNEKLTNETEFKEDEELKTQENDAQEQTQQDEQPGAEELTAEEVDKEEVLEQANQDEAQEAQAPQAPVQEEQSAEISKQEQQDAVQPDASQPAETPPSVPTDAPKNVEQEEMTTPTPSEEPKKKIIGPDGKEWITEKELQRRMMTGEVKPIDMKNLSDQMMDDMERSVLGGGKERGEDKDLIAEALKAANADVRIISEEEDQRIRAEDARASQEREAKQEQAQQAEALSKETTQSEINKESESISQENQSIQSPKESESHAQETSTHTYSYTYSDMGAQPTEVNVPREPSPSDSQAQAPVEQKPAQDKANVGAASPYPFQPGTTPIELIDEMIDMEEDVRRRMEREQGLPFIPVDRQKYYDKFGPKSQAAEPASAQSPQPEVASVEPSQAPSSENVSYSFNANNYSVGADGNTMNPYDAALMGYNVTLSPQSENAEKTVEETAPERVQPEPVAEAPEIQSEERVSEDVKSEEEKKKEEEQQAYPENGQSEMSMGY